MLQFTGFKVELVQFRDLVSKQVQACGIGLGLVSSLFDFFRQGLPIQRQCCHLGDQAVRICRRIEQRPLIAPAQQGLMGVLAVNIHQQCADGCAVCEGGRGAVDESLGTAISANDPPQNTFVVG